MHPLLFRLQCGVNSYEWGKIGQDSAAARFGAATNLEIQPGKPYAELWMGTHPSNPSKDLATGRSLAELVREHPHLLSAPVAQKFASQLPFLFKVLSINKALSIQAHPNKTLAEQLHKRDPDHYPDGNHKPEMAIAITHFEGLCGFRPLVQVSVYLRFVTSLRALVGPDVADRFIMKVDYDLPGDYDHKEELKRVFSALMKSSKKDIARESRNLVIQVKQQEKRFGTDGVEDLSARVIAELVLRLYGQFGADIGLFVLFFLNFVTLDPGEALFLEADDIHAYISGDIMECMATSDNVVRAGLTPKFKDVDTLVDMLTYNSAPIDDQKMVPKEYPYATLNRPAYSSGSAILLYDPPIEEFSVVRTVLRGGSGSKATFDPLEGPSVIICTGGKGRISVGSQVEDMEEGYVFFAGSTAEVVLESVGGDDADEFVTFKAFCEIDASHGGSK